MRRSILIPTLLIAGLAVAGVYSLMRDGFGDALLLNPAELDFGTLSLGEEAQQVAIATNTGDEPIELLNVRVPEGFHVSRDGLRLAAGEAAELLVLFRPEKAGEVSGELVLENGSRSVAISLRASVHLPAAIRVEPKAISFGGVGIGRSSSVELVIANDGGGALRVDSLAAPKPFRVSDPSFSVAAGESHSVELHFEPEKAGKFDGFLFVRNNDPDNRNVQIRVDGKGLEQAPDPRIEVSPLSLDFGRVTSCTGPQQWVTVRNSGPDPLTIAALRYPAGFLGPARSRSVGPGREFSFPVTFAPRDEGARAGDLKIFSNDPGAAVVAVGLSGRGSACSEEAIRQIATRRPMRRPGTAGGSGGAGGEELSLADGGLLPGEEEPRAPGEEDQPDVLADGSCWRLASYESCLASDSVGEGAFYDPDTGTLNLPDIFLPPVDAALGEIFQADSIDITGQVDALGEFETTVDLRIYDTWGNPIDVPVTVTTGEVSTIIEGGRVISLQGEPFGTGSTPKLVFLATFPPRSALAGQPIKGNINVNDLTEN